MFRIHTKNGQTVHVDLHDESQAREWLQRLKDTSFQEQITGVSVLQKCSGRFRCPSCNRPKRLVCTHCGRPEDKAMCDKTIQYAMARPEGFDQIFYHLEGVERDAVEGVKGGEKITCFVDEVRVTALVHREQPSARIALLKTGKQRYNPFAE